MMPPIRHHSHFRDMSPLEHVLRDRSFVQELQGQLRSAGLYTVGEDGRVLKDDGIAGQYTRKALQEWVGVKPTGVLNPASMRAITQKLQDSHDDPIAQNLSRQLAKYSPASLKSHTTMAPDAAQTQPADLSRGTQRSAQPSPMTG